MSDYPGVQLWTAVYRARIFDFELFCHECAALYIPEKKEFYLNQPVWVSSIQGIGAPTTEPFMHFRDTSPQCVAQWTFPSVQLRDEVHARVIEEITKSLVVLT